MRDRRGEFPVDVFLAEGIDIIIVKSWTGQYGQIEEALRGAIALQRRMGLVLVRSLSCL